MADNNTGNQGFASPNYDEKKAQEVRSKGGKASGASGAAGHTEAAKRGGQNSGSNS